MYEGHVVMRVVPSDKKGFRLFALLAKVTLAPAEKLVGCAVNPVIYADRFWLNEVALSNMLFIAVTEGVSMNL